MKTSFFILLFCFSMLLCNAVEVIRINQLGYLPKSVKVAVFLSSEKKNESEFTIHEAFSDKVVFTGKPKVLMPKTGECKRHIDSIFRNLKPQVDII